MVATFLVTGSASGMGQAAAERLRSSGHRVIGVDVKDADVVADLSTDTGRAVAAAAVVEQCGGVLDGAVLAAGLGPIAGRDRLIVQVNYFGVVTLLTALQPALARSGRAKVVVVSSNSTTTTPAVPRRAVRALLDGDAERALRAVRWFGKRSSPMIYAASKIAELSGSRVLRTSCPERPINGEHCDTLGGRVRIPFQGFTAPLRRLRAPPFYSGVLR